MMEDTACGMIKMTVRQIVQINIPFNDYVTMSTERTSPHRYGNAHGTECKMRHICVKGLLGTMSEIPGYQEEYSSLPSFIGSQGESGRSGCRVCFFICVRTDRLILNHSVVENISGRTMHKMLLDKHASSSILEREASLQPQT
jgi:hypothetical protein